MNDFSISRVAFSRWWITLVLGLVSLLFAACAPQTEAPTKPGGGQTPIGESTKWTLVSFGKPDAETPVIAGSTITIEFSPDGRASGSGGCNTYSAAYDWQENRLTFSAITSTKMACGGAGVGLQEQNFFNALQAAVRFELTEDRLLIWYGGGQDVLNWQRSR